jgi:hypothetical protein
VKRLRSGRKKLRTVEKRHCDREKKQKNGENWLSRLEIYSNQEKMECKCEKDLYTYRPKKTTGKRLKNCSKNYRMLC